MDDLQKQPNDGAITSFQQRVKKYYQQYFQLLEQQINQQLFEQAADTLRKLKFVQKMQEELDKLEESLFDL